uniref:Uncharacterized protein n=1 Tax=Anguilla anguilla TaxID=7936 RepID=A0A0E9VCR1_ANGAN
MALPVQTLARCPYSDKCINNFD